MKARMIPGDAVFGAVALAASYYFAQLHFLLIREIDCARGGALMRGVANTPYQYRALVPWIARGVSWAAGLLGRHPAPDSVFFALEAAAVFLALLAFRGYLSLLVGAGAAAVLAFTMYYALLFNFTLPVFASLRYPSDIPSVLFFTAGLALLYTRHWILYYPLFCLATLNRETSIFLTAVFIITSWGRMPAASLARHAIIQLVLWLSIKYWLHHLYLSNPGSGLFERHFMHNLPFFASLRNYPYFLSTMGFAWVPCLFLFRRVRDAFVRRALLVALPYLAGMICVGNVYEVRLHAELIPVILPACILILKELLAGTPGKG